MQQDSHSVFPIQYEGKRNVRMRFSNFFVQVRACVREMWNARTNARRQELKKRNYRRTE